MVKVPEEKKSSHAEKHRKPAVTRLCIYDFDVHFSPQARKAFADLYAAVDDNLGIFHTDVRANLKRLAEGETHGLYGAISQIVQIVMEGTEYVEKTRDKKVKQVMGTLTGELVGLGRQMEKPISLTYRVPRKHVEIGPTR